MNNYEIYDGLTICDVYRMAKQMLQYNSAYVDPVADQEHYRYFLWQTRKKISDVMLNTDTPIIQITYDTLVHRDAYLKYVYSQTSGYDLTPHELNMKREEKLEEEKKRFKDVPLKGYEHFGIIKYIINTTIDKVNIESLRSSVSAIGKIAAFLWYDFTNETKNLTFPIITW